MRTVHTYTPSTTHLEQEQPEQQQQQSQLASSSSSSSTNQQNLHPHSSMSGYSSARHSLLRMHSQLRSAPHRREPTQDPIDLSQHRATRQLPKMTTRSTSTTITSATSTNPTLRAVPIITSLVTTPTHTIYSSAVPSFTTSTTTTNNNNNNNNNNHQNPTFLRGVHSASVDQIVKYLSSPPPAPPSSTSTSISSSTSVPKLAYAYSNIEENLQCPLCIDRLRDPRALPCQHVFCCSCLKSIPSSNLPYPTIACPLCRRTFPYNGADQFPVSYIHRQLLDLVPKNYDVNGKCTKCEEKSSLILCSCCDFLLCRKCYDNDREKILDNIQHVVKTCSFRLNRIHQTRDQLNDLNEQNRRKIQQIENLFENFERKFFSHKQTVLGHLKRFNEQIQEDFWNKLNISCQTTTEPFVNLLVQADNLLKKSPSSSFDDILSLFYNLTSIDEQLEQANSLIDTCDIQNLFKQNIQLSNDEEMEEQVRIHLKEVQRSEKIFPLIPPSILPRSSKRQRKTEPKRHVEEPDEVDDDDEEKSQLPICKRLKIECEQEQIQSSPTSPIDGTLFSDAFTAEQGERNEINDNDIIYLETIQGKSPGTLNFEDLFQIIDSNE